MNLSKRVKWVFVCVFLMSFLILVMSHSVVAQVTASITGRIEDASGAAAPGVMVTVTNLETSVPRTVMTDSEGNYRVLSLAVGRYEVKAEKAGFKTAVQTGVTLVVGQQGVVNLALEVGAVQQQVTVSEDALLVNTTTASTSGLVGEKEVKDLPLNGRSFDQLIALNAGAANMTMSAKGTQVGSGGAGAQVGNYFTVSGRGWGENVFLLNGVEYPGPSDIHSEPGGVSGQMLGVDAVREFNVQADAYGAQYGQRAGGQISIVTMSGTNALHGTVFEFLRNSALDARNFFDQGFLHGQGRIPPFKRNQFGGALGGPLKKDKTFVFGNYEGFRQRLGVSNLAIVPDDNARNGKLPCNSITPLPASCTSSSDTTPTTVPNQPVANSNGVTMLDILRAYWPVPNGAVLGGGQAQAFYNPPQSIQEDFGTARVDHNFSTKDLLNASYLIDDGNSVTPIVDPLWTQDITVRSQVLSLQETHLFSSNLINTLTVGYSRSRFHFVSAPYVPIPTNVYFLQGPSTGQIRVTGGLTAGGGLTTTDQQTARNMFTYEDDLQWIRGNHQLSFGVWFKPLQSNDLAPLAQGGSTTFSSSQAFLQGNVQLFNVTPKPTHMYWRQKEGAWYIQDTIQVRKNLTVRVGLRHEFNNGWNEAHDNAYSFRYGSDGVLLTAPVGPFRSPYTQNNAVKLFGPRVGLAWDIFGKGKSSIRAGFGTHFSMVDNPRLFLDALPPNNSQVAFANTAFLPLIPLNPNVALPPVCGPGVPGSIDPVTGVKSAGSCTTFAPGGVQENLKTPTVEEWNLSFEQQIAPNTSLSLAYVGSHSFHGLGEGDPNQIPSQICANAAGCLAGGMGAATFTVAKGTLYVPVQKALPNPYLSIAMNMLYGDINSSYNALNVELTHRVSNGLQFKAAYTYSALFDFTSDFTNWGNILDTYHPETGNGRSRVDLPNKFVFSGGYDLPIGRNKHWLNGVTGAADKLVSGWKVNSIVVIRSGFPFTPITGTNRAANGENNGGTPNYNPAFTGPIITGNINQWFDPNAFLLPAPGTFGNVPFGSLRGPNFRNVDLSIFKTTAITERVSVQFRAEAFNLFNRANFGNPSNVTVFSGTIAGSKDPGTGQPLGMPSSSAGVITAAATSRQLQFGLKLSF